ncbi:hypothetical protein SADUNF_Sadunf13G0048000 [Salix dunnii]|uniref:Uncharacterized protein n=1 Tax=Salix dunnii TaxID=1413687 RepID=A0A835JID2_9ROSI|nr:hypothetical protein SADUNF_Sadunf13G0048000 [Salix dunnii]
MEALKMRVFLAIMAVLMAVSAVQNAAAAVEAPAPSPTSDATAFAPAVLASLISTSVRMDLESTNSRIGFVGIYVVSVDLVW